MLYCFRMRARKEVFCRHEERGCGWQGELGTFHTHVESCPMKKGPPMSELVKLPV